MIKGLYKLNEYSFNFKNKLDNLLKIVKISATGIALAVVLVGCEHSADMNVNKGLSSADYVDIKTNLNKYYIVKDNGEIIYEDKDSLSSEYKNSNYLVNSSYPNLIISKKITDKTLEMMKLAKEDLDKNKDLAITNNVGISQDFINAAKEDGKIVLIKSNGSIDYIYSTDEQKYSNLKPGDIAFENDKLNTLYQNQDYEKLIEELNKEFSTEPTPEHTHSGGSNMLLWYMLYNNMLQQNSTMSKNIILSNNLYNNSTLQYHTNRYNIEDNIDRHENRVFRNPDDSTTDKGLKKASTRTTSCCGS